MLNRLRRFGFRLLYNECAFSYDLVSAAVSLGRWRSWQRSALRFLPAPEAGLALELAQGTGELQIDLVNAGYRTVALDLSRSMGKLARRKLARHGLRASLATGDAARLPFQSCSVAALVCTFPTSFICQPQTLAEIERVLRQDGRAVIVLTGRLSGSSIIRWLIKGLYRLSGQAYRAIDDAALRDMFDANGLTAETQVVQLADSRAQVVILHKYPGAARKQRDHRLELARQP
ncbi:MAG: methyltransferase domain-containing protein [Chloroflexi bacterium]|nr:methyltransferase domain-containing protein [Chloroflexota bacterium]